MMQSIIVENKNKNYIFILFLTSMRRIDVKNKIKKYIFIYFFCCYATKKKMKKTRKRQNGQKQPNARFRDFLALCGRKNCSKVLPVMHGGQKKGPKKKKTRCETALFLTFAEFCPDPFCKNRENATKIGISQKPPPGGFRGPPETRRV